MNRVDADTTAPALGRMLRQRRKALGISMAAAAEAADMSRFTWHKLENGEIQVALGFMLAAARVLGLECRLVCPDEASDSGEGALARPGWLPLDIRLTDYPGLQRLAWQLRAGVDTLTPREAWELYERNARHLDSGALEPHEKTLMLALRKTFGGGPGGI